MGQVRAADFSTPPGGAVFWTGYREGNQARAMAWAARHGKSTIEMTPGGRWLEDLDLYGPKSPVSRAEANELWKAASENYAMGASGRVNAFTAGTSWSPDSVFYGTELPILRANPNVSPRITYRGYSE
jgi:hypothetical protein